MATRQLFKKVQVHNRATGKVETRYEVLTDAGKDPVTGKRRQVRRRFKSERKRGRHFQKFARKQAKGHSSHARH